VFTASAAWLVLAVIAFNPATSTGTDPKMAKATTATIRGQLIAVSARVATSARRMTLHLPQAWRWEAQWTEVILRVNCQPATIAP